MNISTDDVMVFIDLSSECYYEDSVWEGVCIGCHVRRKGRFMKRVVGQGYPSL